MVVLRFLGAVYAEGDAGLMTGPAAQRHRLALLAILATARSHTAPREKLMSLLWPERDAEHVRRLLNQSIYVLRQVLGETALRSVADSIRLEPGAVVCDVISFELAAAAGHLEQVVDLYTGPFLDGLYLNGSPDFESWAAEERSRLANTYTAALRGLGESCEAHRKFRAAADWWKTLVAHDPYDSTAVLRLLRALIAAGDETAALNYAEQHEKLLRQELGIGLPRDLAAIIETIVSARRQPVERPADITPSPQVADSVPATAILMSQGTEETPSPGDSVTRRWRSAKYGIAGVSAACVLIALAAFRVDKADTVPATPYSFSTGLLGIPQPEQQPGGAIIVGVERRTQSIAAYELYLRANDPSLSRSNTSARQAIDYLRQAVALDPAYAAGWASLGRASLRVALGGELIPDEQLFALAEEAARKAVTLDDTVAEGHAVLGLLSLFAFDFTAAESRFVHAIELDPTRAATREWLAGLYLWMGKPAEALLQAEQAVITEPFSPSARAELARALAANGHCDEALGLLEQIATVEPPLLRAPLIAAHCHARKQQWPAAIAALRTAPPPLGPLQQAMLGQLLAQTGQRDEALAIRASLHERWQHGGGGALLISIVDAGLGDLDQAMIWLERSLEDRSLFPTADQFTVLQPVIDQLQSDSRIESLPMFAHWKSAFAF